MSNRTRLPLGDYYQLLLRHGLLADAAPLAADLTRPVSLVSCDSKLIIPNTLFVCKGAKFKEEYLRSAMEQGAFAYVSEREYPAIPLPCIRVTDIRQAMGLLADRAYGHPSGALRITGITGTKGKTTTAYYIKSIVDAWLAGQGHRESALLSTIVTDDGVERRPAKLTTPEPLDLQRHLWNAVSAGADYLTMEVSSQALKYGRVIGVELACAVFLNIGEDHISPVEHPDLEDYLNSKLLIFQQARSACVCLDCDHVERVRAAAAACPRVVTFSQKFPSADVYGSQVRKEGFAWSRQGIDTVEAAEAFAQWCAYYADYGLPLSYDFYNRFRTGEMPMAVADYTVYLQLYAAAPEIKGFWDMVPVPGTVGEDGAVNDAVVGYGADCAIILGSSEKPESAWKFLDWFTSDDIQAAYGNLIEARLGTIGRYPTANKRAFQLLPVNAQLRGRIQEQWEKVMEVPQIPASYYVGRNLTNAYRRVIYYHENPRQTLHVYNNTINREIARKNAEIDRFTEKEG